MIRALFATVCILLIAATALPVLADGPTTHTVAWGESLYGIARAYGVTPQAIASANGIQVTSWVYVGQRLSIPTSASTLPVSTTPSGYYVVRPGDTLYSIARRFGTTVAVLSSLNRIPASGLIFVGWTLRLPSTDLPAPTVSPPSLPATPVPPPSTVSVYIVQRGDYLSRIALRFGSTVQAIVIANNIQNAWLIYPGQRLVIPASQSAPSAPPPSQPGPTPTRTPPPPQSTGVVWIPSFPAEWPPGVNYAPASVSRGQTYWRLARAQYCDLEDPRNGCPNLPGGNRGTQIYVSLFDGAGDRASGTLIVVKSDGTLAGVPELGPQKAADDLCNCNYSFFPGGWPISVAGAPSDTISGLAEYSLRLKWPQAHVRYYLTFQLATR